MQLDPNIIPYLQDRKFSEGLYIKTSSSQKKLDNRIDSICGYASGKKIIHVGCIDHIPLIEKKIQAGLWLHKRLDEVAHKQVGIDVNKEGIDLVKKLGYGNVYFEDIESAEQPGNFIQQEKWDAMILGEILEHVNDPVQFLRKLKSKYAAFVQTVLISVPNAFALENFRLAIKHKECINSDHRSWFSLYTLAKVLTVAGFSNFNYQFVTSEPNDYKGSFFIRQVVKKYPSLRSTILMEAQFETA